MSWLAGLGVVDERGRRVEAEADGRLILRGATRCVVTAPVGAARAWLGERELTQAGARGRFRVALERVGARATLRLEVDGALLEVPLEARGGDAEPAGRRWAALLAELDAWLPAGALGTVSARDRTRAMLGLLPAWRRAVVSVLLAPRGREVGREVVAPVRGLRRVEPGAVAWLARRPRALASLEEGDPGALLLRWQTRDSLDHPANRAVAWMARHLGAGLRDEAASQDARQPGGADAEALRWEAEEVDALVARSALGALEPAPPQGAALAAVLDDPLYARVYSLSRRLLGLRAGVTGGEGAADGPGLYGLWAFLTLGEALERCLPGWRWRRGEPVGGAAVGGGSLVGASPDGRSLGLYLGPRFPSIEAAPQAPRRSLAGARRPTMALAVRAGAGAGAWACFDAGDGVGVEQARQRVHTHRDALWWEVCGGRAALGLWLDADEDALDWGPWGAPGFRRDYGLGVWRLVPGASVDREALEWLLGRLGALARP